MKKIFNSIIILLFTQVCFAQLTLRIIELPSNTPTNAYIYVAGNFQGWDPGSDNYKLTDVGNGIFEIEITPSVGALEFKFTRGNWGSVEGNASGGAIPNRTYNYTGAAATLDLTILSWEDLSGSSGTSTATSNVQILDENFFMPQLNRSRRIWIYLPPDYDSSQKDYPVLYMHDGQNVFDASTSFSGEWEVDESLNQLFNEGDYGVIVVAIDNGANLRVDEYSPWNNPNYGGGEGDEYIEFIVNTLKPHIDSNYRTLASREYTGLMGSSLGALISLYGGIEYQDVFSKVGLFSPSYWFADECFDHVENIGKQETMKFYSIIGALEGPTHVNNMNQMKTTLMDAGFTSEELNQMVHNDGQHSEWYWAREFPAAYEWLFGDLDLTASNESLQNSINIFPNPVSKNLFIKGIEKIENQTVEIFYSSGQLRSREKLISNQLDLQQLPLGFYFIRISDESGVIFLEKITRIE